MNNVSTFLTSGNPYCGNYIKCLAMLTFLSVFHFGSQPTIECDGMTCINAFLHAMMVSSESNYIKCLAMLTFLSLYSYFPLLCICANTSMRHI